MVLQVSEVSINLRENVSTKIYVPMWLFSLKWCFVLSLRFRMHLVLFSRCCEPSGENNILLVLLYPFANSWKHDIEQNNMIFSKVKISQLKITTNQMHPESVVYITWIHWIFSYSNMLVINDCWLSQIFR